jgi:hypothetical protein
MVEMRVGPATNSLPLISRSLNQEFPVYGALASRTLGPAYDRAIVLHKAELSTFLGAKSSILRKQL